MLFPTAPTPTPSLPHPTASESFWQPYIATLPSTYTTPLYWEMWELLALKGSPTFVEALRLYKHVARQYAYIYNKFAVCFHFPRHIHPRPPPSHTRHPVPRLAQESGISSAMGIKLTDLTYDDYRWAVSTIMTRQNKVPLKIEYDAQH